jgi:hypothetical protein
LIDLFKSRANVIVEVHSLKTGYSSETHGTIHVSCRHQPSPVTSAIIMSKQEQLFGIFEQTILYKALDTGIRCSAISSSGLIYN